MTRVLIGHGARRVEIGDDLPLTLIAGPCALESRDLALKVAGELAAIGERLKIGVVFKASFDKANRTSGGAARGVGLDAALPIFAEIREKTGLPVTTDVHEAWQCARVAEVVDLLQIPAFLCRQTDLIVAAAKTGRPVNIKKGPFLAPWDMIHAVEKAREAGAAGVLVTERGTSFGYNALVADMRGAADFKGDRRARYFRRDARRAAAGRTRDVVGRRAAFRCNARPRRGRRRGRGAFHRDASRSGRGDLRPRDASPARRARNNGRGADGVRPSGENALSETRRSNSYAPVIPPTGRKPDREGRRR